VRVNESPSIIDLARNFTVAMSKWVASGFDTVTAEQYAEREARCKPCEHHKLLHGGLFYGCALCGCNSSLKIHLATEVCLAGKWKSL
jgi:hypothetical protein